jgi:hypothetical protein
MPNQQAHFNLHLKISHHITHITNLRYSKAVLDREIHKLEVDHYGHQQFKPWIVKQHAVDAWNDRVYPHVDRDQLQMIISTLATMPNRIRFAANRRRQLCLLDNEILFGYHDLGDRMVITTFYGRLSMHPMLRFVASTEAPAPRVDLHITPEEGSHLTLPIIPAEVCTFSFCGNPAMIEVYNDDQGHPVFYRRQRATVSEIRLDDEMDKAAKAALEFMGYVTSAEPWFSVTDKTALKQTS